ncbi:ergosterol biosynthesis protein [Steccherinum ochraceum]|uniref:Ergosterol biosynthesis protein n=1 Tax=Steccherinum ochraceum TaxID=92696 RepID=A0A4R0RGU5_9APHY|nr:ergosterol biosynthesis protein [Steccherinum ochraceum]
MSATFFSLLPQATGWLPKWQLFVASLALFNTVQNFTTVKLTKRVYANKPHEVTALQARTFAVWTLLSAAVRFYAAYHINEKSVYDITLISYLIAFGHATSELLIYRTASLSVPSLSPVIVSTVAMTWMFKQYDFYIQP